MTAGRSGPAAPADRRHLEGGRLTERLRPGPTWAEFPLEARLAWMNLAPDEQEAILEAAWCPACMKSTPFEVLGGRLVAGGLALSGRRR